MSNNIEAICKGAELDVIALLSAAPDPVLPATQITRRTDTFLPDRDTILDVRCFSPSISGSHVNLDVRLELQLITRASREKSSLAVDVVRYIGQEALARVLGARLGWNDNHKNTQERPLSSSADNVPVWQYEQLLEFKFTHSLMTAAATGIVQQIDTEMEVGHALSIQPPPSIVLQRPDTAHVGPIVAFAITVGTETIELINSTGAVVDGQAADAGTNEYSFDATALPEGAYSAAVNTGSSKIFAPGTTTIFRAPTEP